MAGGRIQFWYPDAAVADVEGWDPDAEPNRNATTVGHALLELYVRLRDGGAPVVLGETPAEPPALVVVAAASVRKDARALERSLRAVARAGGRVALVRSDTPLSWRYPLEPTCEVMPYRGVATAPHQRWLPPLPQRGLQPRRAAALDRIATVAIKCNPVTLPEALRGDGVAAALAAEGVRLWLDVPSRTDGSDQRWHDFSDVDAVLCARADDVGADWTTSKPATKLINAWAAGCIPIASREASYVELARDGEDVSFLDDVGDLPRVVAALNADAAALRRLRAGVQRRRTEFTSERVVELWRELLVDLAATAPASRRRATRARALATEVRVRRLDAHVRLALRLRAARWRRRGGDSAAS